MVYLPFLLLAVAVGAATPFIPAAALAVLLGLATIPVLLVVTSSFPIFGLGLFVGLQFMEAFEVETPVGTFSPGITVLLMLLYFHGGELLRSLRESRSLRLAILLLAAWLIAHAARLSYDPFEEVLRILVTDTAAVAVFLLGAAFARPRGAMRAAALGATAALLVLGGSALLAALGYLPPPERFGESRALFGIQSPFPRNYGLNVPLDAVAFLAPLALSFLALAVTRRDGGYRIASAAALLALGIVFVFLFQARGMSLLLLLAVVVALVFRFPRFGLIGVVCAIPLVWGGVMSMTSSDAPEARIAVSNELRSSSYEHVWSELLNNPEGYVAGRDEGQFIDDAAARSSQRAFIIAGSYEEIPVHNVFLSELVGGGYFAFITLLAVYLLAARHAVRLLLAAPRDFDTQVRVTAMGLLMFSVLVEPGAANIVGSWLILGLVLGKGVPRRAGVDTDRTSSPPLSRDVNDRSRGNWVNSRVSKEVAWGP